MAAISDDDLIEQTLAGDAKAFAVLIKRYEQPLAALIRRQVVDPHHQEDVLQETLLQAWRSLQQLQDRSKITAWLIAIARNRCRDFRKSAARRESPTDSRTLQRCINRTGRAVRGSDDRQPTEEMIERVPLTQRETAELFYVQGLTITEIARRLEQREGTIKSRLYHARRALRRAFD